LLGGEACEALAADLGRSSTEAKSELQTTLAECDRQIQGLKSGWMDPEPRRTHLLLAPAHTEVRREPFGVALVIGPFNYPMNLVLSPLVGALAAGNVVVVKPSELTPMCEAWFARRLAKALPPKVGQVVRGGAERTAALLNECKFDLVFFTGSPRVGRLVAAAAARHLTPCVLELGGKAPCVVGPKVASLGECAKRIVLGKFVNAGQTCVAPDYVLVHASHHKALLEQLVKCVESFYGPDPSVSRDYGRMCTQAHAKRQVRLIETSGAKQVLGGAAGGEQSGLSSRGAGWPHDPESKYVAPTILDEPRPGAPVLTEEVFGPILTVLPFGQALDAAGGDDDAASSPAALASEVARLIQAVDPQPLALYVFSEERDFVEGLLGAVQSGDAMVNDTFMHFLSPCVPFGGVGTSGHGTYRGRLSFEAFTYPRGVVFKHGLLDLDQSLSLGGLTGLSVRYPPSGRVREALLPWVIANLPSLPRVWPDWPWGWPRRRSRGFALSVSLAAAGAAVLLGAEAQGQPPFSFAAGLARDLARRIQLAVRT